MLNLKESTEKQALKYRPRYFVEYEHLVWHDNRYTPDMVEDEEFFTDIEEMIIWVIRSYKHQEKFKLLSVYKMEMPTEDEFNEIENLYTLRLKQYEQKEEEERKKKEAEKIIEAECKKRLAEDNERKLYFRLKEKYEK